MPARLPTRLKLLSGTARPSWLKREPEPPPGPPEPPKWLDATARRHWGELVPVLESMRVLTTADGAALALVCSALAEHERAAAVVAERGAAYEAVTEAGSVMHRPRPEVAIAADSWRRALRSLTEFGLSPSSRARLDVEPGTVARRDPADEFFDD
jgi:P27 family predicted phage terminase small subunit